MKLNSKYFDKIRIRRDQNSGAKPDAPQCQWDGCEEPGLHKAPVGRDREGEYFCFCFEHVRQYNRSYNYFSGLKDSEIARYQKEAMTGHRPTWKVGGIGEARAASDFAPFRSGHAGYYRRLGDPLNLFGGEKSEDRAPVQRRLRPLEAKAFETLGLEANATGTDIKARYKALVKRHHPDANGGDRSSEARLRDVLQAYRLLKQAGFC